MTSNSEPSRPRVLIADHDAPTRLGVRRALEAGGFEVCAEATDAASAVAGVKRHRPAVAVLDVRLPGNGILAAAEIVANFDGVAVVMLTVSSDDDDLFAALLAGADGYLLKGTGSDQLPRVLRAVLDGEVALPRSLVRKVVGEFRRRGRSPELRMINERPVRLTAREWEVLDGLAEGLTTAAIAKRLFVSTVTVRTHVSTIIRKLGVADRAAAIALVHADDENASS